MSDPSEYLVHPEVKIMAPDDDKARIIARAMASKSGLNLF
jgi:hypothetical protein